MGEIFNYFLLFIRYLILHHWFLRIWRFGNGAVAAGRMEQAGVVFNELGEQTALPGSFDIYTFADWLFHHNTPENALTALRFYAAHYPRGTELDRVHLLMGLIQLQHYGRKVAARAARRATSRMLLRHCRSKASNRSKA